MGNWPLPHLTVPQFREELEGTQVTGEGLMAPTASVPLNSGKDWARSSHRREFDGPYHVRVSLQFREELGVAQVTGESSMASGHLHTFRKVFPTDHFLITKRKSNIVVEDPGRSHSYQMMEVNAIRTGAN